MLHALPRSLFLDQNRIFSDLFQAQFFDYFIYLFFSALLTQTSLKVWVPNTHPTHGTCYIWAKLKNLVLPHATL